MAGATKGAATNERRLAAHHPTVLKTAGTSDRNLWWYLYKLHLYNVSRSWMRRSVERDQRGELPALSPRAVS